MVPVDEPFFVPYCYFDVMTEALETFQTFCITNRPVSQTSVSKPCSQGKSPKIIFRTLRSAYLRKLLQSRKQSIRS